MKTKNNLVEKFSNKKPTEHEVIAALAASGRRERKMVHTQRLGVGVIPSERQAPRQYHTFEVGLDIGSGSSFTAIMTNGRWVMQDTPATEDQQGIYERAFEQIDESVPRILSDDFWARRAREMHKWISPEQDSASAEDAAPAATAAEIHADLNRQSDAIVREALEILARAEDAEIAVRGKRAEELAELGFGSVPSVEMDRERLDRSESRRLRMDAIAGYVRDYPQNRFISDAVLHDICGKYGLVCTNSFYFKGEIPEANIREILDFRVKPEHAKPNNRNDAEKIEKARIAGLPRMKGVDLLIVAPENQLTDGAIRNVVAGQLRNKRQPFDPIVLQPVLFGYLVVTAWGDEAQDENIVNPNKN